MKFKKGNLIMSNKTKMALLCLLSLLLLFSCKPETKEPTQVYGKVVINTDYDTQSRTVTPSIDKPDFIEITLTNSQHPEYSQTKEFETETASYTFENVALGTYAVSARAYDKSSEGKIIYQMTSVETASLSVNSTITTCSISMQAISEGDYTGGILMKFDWKEALSGSNKLKEATAKGVQLKLYMTYGDECRIIDECSTAPGATSATLQNNVVPVTKGSRIWVEMFDHEDKYFLGRLYSGFVNIYSGYTSTIDDLEHGVNVEDGVIIVSPDDVPDAQNVSNVDWKYGEDPSSEILVTWDNTQDFSEVHISWGPFGTKDITNSAVVTFDESSPTGSYLITGLEQNVRMYVSMQTVLRYDNSKSAVQDFIFNEKPMIAKTFVESIDIEETNLPGDTIEFGDSFTLSATISPETATIKDYEWTVSDPEVLAVSGNTFTAMKPGTATITVTSTDNPEKTDTSSSVTVRLGQPQNLAVEVQDYSNIVSWNNVHYAASYDVFRSEDGADFSKIGSSDSLFFLDENLSTGKEYTYKVAAQTEDKDESYRSIESDTVKSTKIQDPAISVDWMDTPSLGKVTVNKSTEILSDAEDLVITVSQQEVEVNKIVEYAFYLNKEIVPLQTGKENKVTITPESKGLAKGYSNYNNILVVKLTDSEGNIYSTSIDFKYIETPDTSVELSVYKGVTRLPSNLVDGEERSFTIAADVSPANATDKRVTYESSDPGILTVDPYTGKATIMQDSYGEVTVTATTAAGNTDSITFSIYKNTVKSSIHLLNAINEVMGDHVKAADDSFGHDWYPGPSASDWKNSDSSVIIYSGSGSNGNVSEVKNGGIYYRNYIIEHSEIGEMTLNADRISVVATNDGWAGYLGTEQLYAIGAGASNDTISVELPYNQGTVQIKYQNISAMGTRGGNYSITYSDRLELDPFGEEYQKSIGDNLEGVVRIFPKEN